MIKSDKFLDDIKEVLNEVTTDDQQLVENAKFTMDHFGEPDQFGYLGYIVGGKFTKTGRVAKFIFKKENNQYEYLSFVQDEPFTEIEGDQE